MRALSFADVARFPRIFKEEAQEVHNAAVDGPYKEDHTTNHSKSSPSAKRLPFDPVGGGEGGERNTHARNAVGSSSRVIFRSNGISVVSIRSSGELSLSEPDIGAISGANISRKKLRIRIGRQAHTKHESGIVGSTGEDAV